MQEVPSIFVTGFAVGAVSVQLAVTVPVSIRVAQAGPCQLVVSELANFQGIRCTLTDAVMGRSVPLMAGATYTFAATPGSSQRFRLHFSLR